MNINKISLNFYSFGFYGGLMKGFQRSKPILGIDDLASIASSFGLGGIEIPLDHFFSINEIDKAVEKIKKIQAQNLSVFIDLENTNVEYISRLVPYLPTLGISVVRIKMDQLGKTIYGGNRYLSKTFNQSVREFKKQLFSLLPILEEHSVSLAIENHQDFHSSELVDISKDISNELIGVTWDIGNSISVLDSPENFYYKTHNIIKNVHLKDYKVLKTKSGISLVRCPLGDGYVSFDKIFNKISKNDGITNMSIELGAQMPRECDINKSIYWDQFSSLLIDKENYLAFVDEVLEVNTAKYFRPKLTENDMIESELNEIESSVNNLKQILEKI